MKSEDVQGSVLLIDDKAAKRKAYARSLGNAGFQVLTASNDEKALQLMKQRRFDVIVSDISMPKKGEASLLQGVRKLSADSSVVLIVDKPTNVESTLPGVRCLVRPIKSTDLTKTVSEVVRQAEPTKPPALQNINAASFTATSAKNDFGRLLEIAIRGGRAVITKHDSPKAVLISIDEFNALTGAGKNKLETLSSEFDALLARMQTPKARAGMRAAFNASPKELAEAASAAARKRG